MTSLVILDLMFCGFFSFEIYVQESLPGLPALPLDVSDAGHGTGTCWGWMVVSWAMVCGVEREVWEMISDVENVETKWIL